LASVSQLATLATLQPNRPNLYAVFGLDSDCTAEQIRAAYRVLAKQLHPDVNGSREAMARTQELNVAYEVLSDADRRRAYDDEAVAAAKLSRRSRGMRSNANVQQEVQLRIEDFFRGTTLTVCVNDPGNPSGAESYEVTIEPGTAPGTRLRVQRTAASAAGFVIIRLRVRPDFRFKPRGSDLRCDLRITPQRATQGGVETVIGPRGDRLPLKIPRGVANGEILRITNEGLPKPRGGRGDLLVKVKYRVPVHVVRGRLDRR